MKKIRLYDVLRYGIEATQRHAAYWLLPVLLFTLAGEGLGRWLDGMPEEDLLRLLLAFFGVLAASFFFSLGMTRGALAAYDRADLHAGAFFDFSRHPGRFLGVSLLLALATTLGFVSLLIPALFVLAFASFALWFVADQGLGPVAAFRKSWAMTRGNRGTILVFTLVMLLPSALASSLHDMGLAGLSAALLLEAALLPIFFNASTYIYRQLEAS
jgi:hypothetical protein